MIYFLNILKDQETICEIKTFVFTRQNEKHTLKMYCIFVLSHISLIVSIIDHFHVSALFKNKLDIQIGQT